MAGQPPQKKFYKDIFPVYQQGAFLFYYEDEIGTASFYMRQDVGFYHINYVAANCRVEQTEERPILSLMSIGPLRKFDIKNRTPGSRGSTFVKHE
jgi:hypothetical protein